MARIDPTVTNLNILRYLAVSTASWTALRFPLFHCIFFSHHHHEVAVRSPHYPLARQNRSKLTPLCSNSFHSVHLVNQFSSFNSPLYSIPPPSKQHKSTSYSRNILSVVDRTFPTQSFQQQPDYSNLPPAMTSRDSANYQNMNQERTSQQTPTSHPQNAQWLTRHTSSQNSHASQHSVPTTDQAYTQGHPQINQNSPRNHPIAFPSQSTPAQPSSHRLSSYQPAQSPMGGQVGQTFSTPQYLSSSLQSQQLDQTALPNSQYYQNPSNTGPNSHFSQQPSSATQNLDIRQPPSNTPSSQQQQQQQQSQYQQHQGGQGRDVYSGQSPALQSHLNIASSPSINQPQHPQNFLAGSFGRDSGIFPPHQYHQPILNPRDSMSQLGGSSYSSVHGLPAQTTSQSSTPRSHISPNSFIPSPSARYASGSGSGPNIGSFQGGGSFAQGQGGSIQQGMSPQPHASYLPNTGYANSNSQRTGSFQSQQSYVNQAQQYSSNNNQSNQNFGPPPLFTPRVARFHNQFSGIPDDLNGNPGQAGYYDNSGLLLTPPQASNNPNPTTSNLPLNLQSPSSRMSARGRHHPNNVQSVPSSRIFEESMHNTAISSNQQSRNDNNNVREPSRYTAQQLPQSRESLQIQQSSSNGAVTHQSQSQSLAAIQSNPQNLTNLQLNSFAKALLNHHTLLKSSSTQNSANSDQNQHLTQNSHKSPDDPADSPFSPTSYFEPFMDSLFFHLTHKTTKITTFFPQDHLAQPQSTTRLYTLYAQYLLQKYHLYHRESTYISSRAKHLPTSHFFTFTPQLPYSSYIDTIRIISRALHSSLTSYVAYLEQNTAYYHDFLDDVIEYVKQRYFNEIQRFCLHFDSTDASANGAQGQNGNDPGSPRNGHHSVLSRRNSSRSVVDQELLNETRLKNVIIIEPISNSLPTPRKLDANEYSQLLTPQTDIVLARLLSWALTILSMQLNNLLMAPTHNMMWARTLSYNSPNIFQGGVNTAANRAVYQPNQNPLIANFKQYFNPQTIHYQVSRSIAQPSVDLTLIGTRDGHYDMFNNSQSQYPAGVAQNSFPTDTGPTIPALDSFEQFDEQRARSVTNPQHSQRFTPNSKLPAPLRPSSTCNPPSTSTQLTQNTSHTQTTQNSQNTQNSTISPFMTYWSSVERSFTDLRTKINAIRSNPLLGTTNQFASIAQWGNIDDLKYTFDTIFFNDIMRLYQHFTNVHASGCGDGAKQQQQLQSPQVLSQQSHNPTANANYLRSTSTSDFELQNHPFKDRFGELGAHNIGSSTPHSSTTGTNTLPLQSSLLRQTVNEADLFGSSSDDNDPFASPLTSPTSKPASPSLPNLPSPTNIDISNIPNPFRQHLALGPEPFTKLFVGTYEEYNAAFQAYQDRYTQFQANLRELETDYFIEEQHKLTLKLQSQQLQLRGSESGSGRGDGGGNDGITGGESGIEDGLTPETDQVVGKRLYTKLSIMRSNHMMRQLSCNGSESEALIDLDFGPISPRSSSSVVDEDGMGELPPGLVKTDLTEVDNVSSKPSASETSTNPNSLTRHVASTASGANGDERNASSTKLTRTSSNLSKQTAMTSTSRAKSVSTTVSGAKSNKSGETPYKHKNGGKQRKGTEKSDESKTDANSGSVQQQQQQQPASVDIAELRRQRLERENQQYPVFDPLYMLSTTQQSSAQDYLLDIFEGCLEVEILTCKQQLENPIANELLLLQQQQNEEGDDDGYPPSRGDSTFDLNDRTPLDSPSSVGSGAARQQNGTSTTSSGLFSPQKDLDSIVEKPPVLSDESQKNKNNNGNNQIGGLAQNIDNNDNTAGIPSSDPGETLSINSLADSNQSFEQSGDENDEESDRVGEEQHQTPRIPSQCPQLTVDIHSTHDSPSPLHPLNTISPQNNDDRGDAQSTQNAPNSAQNAQTGSNIPRPSQTIANSSPSTPTTLAHTRSGPTDFPFSSHPQQQQLPQHQQQHQQQQSFVGYPHDPAFSTPQPLQPPPPPICFVHPLLAPNVLNQPILPWTSPTGTTISCICCSPLPLQCVSLPTHHCSIPQLNYALTTTILSPTTPKPIPNSRPVLGIFSSSFDYLTTLHQNNHYRALQQYSGASSGVGDYYSPNGTDFGLQTPDYVSGTMFGLNTLPFATQSPFPAHITTRFDKQVFIRDNSTNYVHHLQKIPLIDMDRTQQEYLVTVMNSNLVKQQVIFNHQHAAGEGKNNPGNSSKNDKSELSRLTHTDVINELYAEYEIYDEHNIPQNPLRIDTKAVSEALLEHNSFAQKGMKTDQTGIFDDYNGDSMTITSGGQYGSNGNARTSWNRDQGEGLNMDSLNWSENLSTPVNMSLFLTSNGMLFSQQHHQYMKNKHMQAHHVLSPNMNMHYTNSNTVNIATNPSDQLKSNHISHSMSTGVGYPTKSHLTSQSSTQHRYQNHSQLTHLSPYNSLLQNTANSHINAMGGAGNGTIDGQSYKSVPIGDDIALSLIDNLELIEEMLIMIKHKQLQMQTDANNEGKSAGHENSGGNDQSNAQSIDEFISSSTNPSQPSGSAVQGQNGTKADSKNGQPGNNATGSTATDLAAPKPKLPPMQSTIEYLGNTALVTNPQANLLNSTSTTAPTASSSSSSTSSAPPIDLATVASLNSHLLNPQLPENFYKTSLFVIPHRNYDIISTFLLYWFTKVFTTPNNPLGVLVCTFVEQVKIQAKMIENGNIDLALSTWNYLHTPASGLVKNVVAATTSNISNPSSLQLSGNNNISNTNTLLASGNSNNNNNNNNSNFHMTSAIAAAMAGAVDDTSTDPLPPLPKSNSTHSTSNSSNLDHSGRLDSTASNITQLGQTNKSTQLSRVLNNSAANGSGVLLYDNVLLTQQAPSSSSASLSSTSSHSVAIMKGTLFQNINKTGQLRPLGDLAIVGSRENDSTMFDVSTSGYITSPYVNDYLGAEDSEGGNGGANNASFYNALGSSAQGNINPIRSTHPHQRKPIKLTKEQLQYEMLSLKQFIDLIFILSKTLLLNQDVSSDTITPTSIIANPNSAGLSNNPSNNTPAHSHSSNNNNNNNNNNSARSLETINNLLYTCLYTLIHDALIDVIYLLYKHTYFHADEQLLLSCVNQQHSSLQTIGVSTPFCPFVSQLYYSPKVKVNMALIHEAIYHLSLNLLIQNEAQHLYEIITSIAVNYRKNNIRTLLLSLFQQQQNTIDEFHHFKSQFDQLSTSRCFPEDHSLRSYQHSQNNQVTPETYANGLDSILSTHNSQYLLHMLPTTPKINKSLILESVVQYYNAKPFTLYSLVFDLLQQQSYVEQQKQMKMLQSSSQITLSSGLGTFGSHISQISGLNNTSAEATLIGSQHSASNAVHRFAGNNITIFSGGLTSTNVHNSSSLASAPITSMSNSSTNTPSSLKSTTIYTTPTKATKRSGLSSQLNPTNPHTGQTGQQQTANPSTQPQSQPPQTSTQQTPQQSQKPALSKPALSTTQPASQTFQSNAFSSYQKWTKPIDHLPFAKCIHRLRQLPFLLTFEARTTALCSILHTITSSVQTFQQQQQTERDRNDAIRAGKAPNATPNSSNSSPSAQISLSTDDLLCILLYIIIQAQVPNLYSILMSIIDINNNNLKNAQFMLGENGFVLTTMLSACVYLQQTHQVQQQERLAEIERFRRAQEQIQKNLNSSNGVQDRFASASDDDDGDDGDSDQGSDDSSMTPQNQVQSTMGTLYHLLELWDTSDISQHGSTLGSDSDSGDEDDQIDVDNVVSGVWDDGEVATPTPTSQGALLNSKAARVGLGGDDSLQLNHTPSAQYSAFGDSRENNNRTAVVPAMPELVDSPPSLSTSLMKNRSGVNKGAATIANAGNLNNSSSIMQNNNNNVLAKDYYDFKSDKQRNRYFIQQLTGIDYQSIILYNKSPQLFHKQQELNTNVTLAHGMQSVQQPAQPKSPTDTATLDSPSVSLSSVSTQSGSKQLNQSGSLQQNPNSIAPSTSYSAGNVELSADEHDGQILTHLSNEKAHHTASPDPFTLITHNTNSLSCKYFTKMHDDIVWYIEHNHSKINENKATINAFYTTQSQYHGPQQSQFYLTNANAKLPLITVGGCQQCWIENVIAATKTVQTFLSSTLPAVPPPPEPVSLAEQLKAQQQHQQQQQVDQKNLKLSGDSIDSSSTTPSSTSRNNNTSTQQSTQPSSNLLMMSSTGAVSLQQNLLTWRDFINKTTAPIDGAIRDDLATTHLCHVLSATTHLPPAIHPILQSMLLYKTQLQQSLLLLLCKTRDRGVWLMQKLLYAPTVTSTNQIIRQSSNTKVSKMWHTLPLLGDITGYTQSEVTKHLPFHNYPISFVSQQPLQSQSSTSGPKPTLYTFTSTPPSSTNANAVLQQHMYITTQTTCLLLIHPFVLFSLLSNPMNKPSYDKHCTKVVVHDIINLAPSPSPPPQTTTPHLQSSQKPASEPSPQTTTGNPFQTVTIATCLYTVSNWLSTSKRHSHVAIYRGGLCTGDYLILFVHLPLNSTSSTSATDKKTYTPQEKAKIWPIPYNLSFIPSTSHEMITVIEGFLIRPHVPQQPPSQPGQPQPRRICSQLFYFNSNNLKGRGQQWLIDALTISKASSMVVDLRDWLVETRTTGAVINNTTSVSGHDDQHKNDDKPAKSNPTSVTPLPTISQGWGGIEHALRTHNVQLLTQLSGIQSSFPTSTSSLNQSSTSQNNTSTQSSSSYTTQQQIQQQQSNRALQHLFHLGSFHIDLKSIPRLCICDKQTSTPGNGSAVAAQATSNQSDATNTNNASTLSAIAQSPVH